jgi:hypothetical protein
MLKERLRVSTISLRLRCIQSECRRAHRKKKEEDGLLNEVQETRKKRKEKSKMDREVEEEDRTRRKLTA